MFKLKTLKERLASKALGISLMPVNRNVTRWSSSYEMIKRYLDIETSLRSSKPLARFMPQPAAIVNGIMIANGHIKELVIVLRANLGISITFLCHAACKMR
jgi:hypothetical protein